MTDCEECEKKLGMLRGYRHPALGINFLVCGKCYDKVDKDMERWRNFCQSDSFNAESSKSDMQDAWNINISNDLPLQRWFDKLWIKQGYQPCIA